ncbi:MAG: hypothetical protein V1667_03460 [bacterium]
MLYSKNGKDIEKTTALNEKVFHNIKTGKEKIESGIELGQNQKAEKTEKILQDQISDLKNNALPPVYAIGAAAAPQAKLKKRVENILSKGLDEIYLNLSADKRKEFKNQGEKTAEKISRILASAKINMREIIKLIKKWLMSIPGVNKYFLEQEAKIKADELVKMDRGNGFPPARE